MTAFVPDNGDLVAEDVACRRGERLIFKGLTCALPPGGALLLTGANGSGKSSLLRLLATLLAPTAGRVMWGGVTVAADLASYRASLHYVGHLDAIKPALGVRETLSFWAGMRGMPEPRIDAALAAFALDSIADWPCRWLSAGQRRRLALARLIVAPAPVWLLDEPTASLDADGEQRLVAAIAEHRASGGRVAIATHQPMALGDARVLALEDFAAAADDPADDPLTGF
ncbi:MAG TPA: heme ABC exporter ATP-binding protein CcmA [Stellaceae bacterium]|nr:heme ABC exporter ATP-binding protein CcmA [Stellaceae bacterium]